MSECSNFNKILVIRYGTIGDTIFASAFYRELRMALPNATIDVLVDYVSNSVMEKCPYINNRINIDGKLPGFFKYITLFRKYDTVFFLKNDNFFSKIAFLAGVKNRIGFDVKRNFKLTNKTKYDNKKHEIDYYLDLLKISGIEIHSDKTEVWLDNSCDKKIASILPITGKNIVIQAFSRFAQKNWIDEYWSDIINYLIDNYDCHIIFIGGSSDCTCYNNILPDINNKSAIINLCGQLSIQESMFLVSKSNLFIGIDSGLIHTAAALDKPSILLNGPTSLVRWKPRSSYCSVVTKNFECSPCCFASSRNKLCKDRESDCMRAIKPEEVIKLIKSIRFLRQLNII